MRVNGRETRMFNNWFFWLVGVQNPDIVLVHYLNVPYPDDAKLLVVASVSLWAERKEWSKDELISQLRPMCNNNMTFDLENWLYLLLIQLFLLSSNSFKPRRTESEQRAGSFCKSVLIFRCSCPNGHPSLVGRGNRLCQSDGWLAAAFPWRKKNTREREKEKEK